MNKEEKKAREICWYVYGHRGYSEDPICPCESNSIEWWKWIPDQSVFVNGPGSGPGWLGDPRNLAGRLER